MQANPTNLHEIAQAGRQNEAHQRFLEQQAADDFRWLMAAPQGRRLMWGWLSDAGVFRNPFSVDAQLTAHNCGQMAQGQRMLEQVMALTPEAFAQMMKDHRNA